MQGICKDCGNGTLNNELNPAFEWTPDMDDLGDDFLVCTRCHSTHLEISEEFVTLPLQTPEKEVL